MVRTYSIKLGAENYKNYSDKDISKVVAEVKACTISNVPAADKYKIIRTTILNKIQHKPEAEPDISLLLLLTVRNL